MKLFGKRGKDRGGEDPLHDPRSTFAVTPLPRHAGPPASSTPLADQLARGGPGVTDGYVVLPRGLAEQMPLAWQQQTASVLAQFHHTHRALSWPVYRVLPSRAERLVDLDEEQLAEAGYVVELDVNGELVYRERSGRKVSDPEHKKVLVTCLDPVQPNRPAGPQPPTPQAQPPGAPVPMNIGPQPVWDVVPHKAHPEPSGPLAPPVPPTAAPPAAPVAQPEATPPPAAAPPPPPVAPPPSVQPPAMAPPVREPEPQADDTETPPRGIALPAVEQPEPAAPPPVVQQPESAAPEPASQAPAVEEPVAEQADPLDWFAEPPVGSERASAEESSGFGPSGDPIERPYRFRS